MFKLIFEWLKSTILISFLNNACWNLSEIGSNSFENKFFTNNLDL